MNAPETIVMALFWVAGGLALFLQGIGIMGKALRQAAGSTLRNSLATLTRTRVHGLITGAALTGLVLQSSSAATVMVVGFIEAGLLTLQSSMGLILGANIGSAVLTLITAMNIDVLALPFVGTGFLLEFIARKRIFRKIGLALMGFGMLLLGLYLMKQAFSEFEGLREKVLGLSGGGIWNWLLLFGIATLCTAVVQSSAATIVLVQSMASQGVSFEPASLIAIVLGAQVGTCVTALLASMRSSLSAKRAAMAHLLFNVFGVMMTLVLFKGYLMTIPHMGATEVVQVAVLAMAIKVVNVAIVLPFTPVLARATKMVLPGEDKLDAAPVFLDYRATRDPALALECASKEISRMCSICMDMLHDSVEAFVESRESLQELVFRREDLVDDIYRTVTDYILTVSRSGLPQDLILQPQQLLRIMADVERIGDHAENIVELASAYAEVKSGLGEEAVRDIMKLLEEVENMGKLTMQIMEDADTSRLSDLLSRRENIDERAGTVLDRHEERLADGRCSAIEGISFTQLITNLRRVANHLRNIAMAAGGRHREILL